MPFHNLIVQAGLATLDGALVATGALNVSGGTLDLDGHAVDLAGALTVAGTILADGVDLHVAGDVIVTGTFDAGTGALVLDGSAPQALDMGASATYDLRVDNSAGVDAGQ